MLFISVFRKLLALGLLGWFSGRTHRLCGFISDATGPNLITVAAAHTEKLEGEIWYFSRLE